MLTSACASGKPPGHTHKRSMSVKKRGTRFVADLTNEGNRYRRQFPTEVEAVAWEAEMRKRILLRISLSSLLDKDATVLTLSQVLDKCYRRHWAGSKNEPQCLVNIGVLENFFGGDALIESITVARIDDFVAFLQRKGRKPGTINNKLATLSKALTFAVERGYIEAKPLIGRVRVGNNARRRFFTRKEEEEIMAACDKHGLHFFKLWFRWSLNTGMRPGETQAATRANVRNDEALGHVIDINEVKSTAGTSDARTIPLNKDAVSAWFAASAATLGDKSSDAPFEYFDSNERARCWKIIRKELNEYDPDFVPYTCRHTCATRLIQAGCNVRAVMAWMGHRDISMTMKYVKLVPEDLVNASQLLLQKKKVTG